MYRLLQGNIKNQMKESFPPWPHYEEDEIQSVINTLHSGKVNYWTGEQGRNFETEYAIYCDNKYAVALANGSVALELALKAMGVGVGDEVVVSPRTFLASASEIVRCGATPVFADVDPDSQNITALSIEAVLSKKSKAVITVHLAGWPCDMDDISLIAKKYDLNLIEDCAQANGARYKDRPVGSFGDVAAFSFCQDKIITTGGEGGMLVTNARNVWEQAWSYKDHGKSYDAVYNREHPIGFKWLHESIGTNYRMTEMQAAIGRIQLRKLDEWVNQRRRNASILSSCFKNISALRVTDPPSDIHHAYYKYYCFVRPEMLKNGWSRDRILEAIVAEGVPCYSGSCSEVYLEKVFEKIGLQPKVRLPVAKELGETSLMFLVHPTLGEQEMNITCNAVEKVFREASI